MSNDIAADELLAHLALERRANFHHRQVVVVQDGVMARVRRADGLFELGTRCRAPLDRGLDGGDVGRCGVLRRRRDLPIGARRRAQAAANALVVVDHRQPVLVLVHSARRARFDARRVRAMVAHRDLVGVLRLGELARRGSDVMGEKHPGRHLVVHLARDLARGAANAFVLVDDHDIARLHYASTFLMLTRVRPP